MNSTASDYFQSYGDIQVHRLMLQDSPRNKAYKKAIDDNKDAFQGKVVLDVGAGTGILSVFCAQAGAARVYSVEASETYIIAEEIIKENAVDNIVQVIHDCIENISLPDDGKVDIIISEWMGFYLLHEGMLDSVIYARDKFLKRDGLIFPESATIYSAPCSVPIMYDDWKNVEGVSMETFSSKLRLQASQKPEMIAIKPEQLLADPEVILWVDLKEVIIDDLNNIKVQHVAVSNKQGKYQGICIWFTCTFPSFITEPVTLSTDPDEPETHWKQTVIVLPNEITVDQLEPISYELMLNRVTSNERRYNIQVTMLDPGEIEHPEYCMCHMTKCILVRAMLHRYEKDGPQADS